MQILRFALLFIALFAFAESNLDSAPLASNLAESSAKNFVFGDLLNQKSKDFINQTSLELFEKTGVNLYVFADSALAESSLDSATLTKSTTITESSLTNSTSAESSPNPYTNFKQRFIQNLTPPFAAIIVIKNAKKIDIIASSDDFLSPKARKKIYWEYMVPLLPQKDDENTLPAVVFNGYVEAVDLIADYFGVEIKHNIAKDEKGAKLVAKGILYIMLFSMLGLFAFIYFFKSKRISQ